MKISGLTSDSGRPLNCNIAIPGEIHSARGRVGVEVLGKKDHNPAPYGQRFERTWVRDTWWFSRQKDVGRQRQDDEALNPAGKIQY